MTILRQLAETEGNLAGYEEAIAFFVKVAGRFQDEEDRFDALLHILHSCKKRRISLPETLDKVTRLFHDHRDLVEDFKTFLPDFSEEGSELQNDSQQTEGHEKKEEDGDSNLEGHKTRSVSKSDPPKT